MRVGLSDKSISMYEKGTVYPPVGNLLKIAKELDKSVSDFLED
jgi:transcriptional regulator with XRE-family HTH domain